MHNKNYGTIMNKVWMSALKSKKEIQVEKSLCEFLPQTYKNTYTIKTIQKQHKMKPIPLNTPCDFMEPKYLMALQSHD